jgi:hypothetical protein
VWFRNCIKKKDLAKLLETEVKTFITAPNMVGSNLAVGRTNKTYISYKSASNTLWQNVLADTCI